MAKESRRTHLVNLLKWRSVVALIACIITMVFSIGGIIYKLLNDPIEDVRTEYQWFTFDSNCLTALAAFMIMPYTIEGIRKKRLTYPKWMQVIHFSGTICLSITMVFVLLFVSWLSPKMAFGKANFFFHIICPIAVIISFFMVESNHHITRKDCLLGLIPFSCFSIMYLYGVVVSKTWEDHYLLNTILPFYITMPLMYLLAFGVARVLRIIHNKLLRYREKTLKVVWDEQLDPVSIKVEVYSLGVHAGLHQEKEDVAVPFDILQEISDKFDIKVDDLAKVYVKGAHDGLKEKAERRKHK